MRSTSGGDAAYDIDFPARDHVLVEQLRNKGAIIYAKAVSTEYNGRAGNPGGRHEPAAVLPSTLGYHAVAGRAIHRTPTTPRARLARVELGLGRLRQHQPRHGQPRRGDARLDARPANHNAVALILPHKAMLGFVARDRRRHLLRSHRDPLPHHRRLREGPRRSQGSGPGILRSARPFTTVPRSSILSTSYASHAKMAGTPGALKGVRIGVIRESMVYPRGSMTEVPIVTAAAKEIKTVLAGRWARRWWNQLIRSGQAIRISKS